MFLNVLQIILPDLNLISHHDLSLLKSVRTLRIRVCGFRSNFFPGRGRRLLFLHRSKVTDRWCHFLESKVARLLLNVPTHGQRWEASGWHFNQTFLWALLLTCWWQALLRLPLAFPLFPEPFASWRTSHLFSWTSWTHQTSQLRDACSQFSIWREWPRFQFVQAF